MRLPPNVVRHVEDLLREVLRFTGPADVALSRYFRDHPKLGGRDRSVVAEAVYGLVRNKAVLSHIAETGVGPQMRRLALLSLAQIVTPDAIAGISPEEMAWLEHAITIKSAHLPAPTRANLPQWLFDNLTQRHGFEQTMLLAEAMNRPAPLDLRVNLIKARREDVLEELAKEGIVCEPVPYAPAGIRVHKKPALQNMPLFKEGKVEVQDEGSQLLAQLLGVRRGDMVVDFCAGAGGKTLALGAIMRNTGRLYAFDVSEKRLAKLKPRLARSGLSNVHPVMIAHEKDAKVKRLSGKIDRVLVDAPCSGLGTLRRNPDMKWRQTSETIAEMRVKQDAILASAARLLKVGGRLVYGTCSILEQENDEVVQAFLAANPGFKLVPASEVLAEQKIDLEAGDCMQLLPHIHQTDGFFAAVFERVA